MISYLTATVAIPYITYYILLKEGESSDLLACRHKLPLPVACPVISERRDHILFRICNSVASHSAIVGSTLTWLDGKFDALSNECIEPALIISNPRKFICFLPFLLYIIVFPYLTGIGVQHCNYITFLATGRYLCVA